MTVLIDYIFFENVFFNIVIILQTAFLSRSKLNKTRIILASIVGSTYVCIMIGLNMMFLNYFWCKLILSFSIVYISFIPKTIGVYLKQVLIYYLATVMNVGGCIVVKEMLVKTDDMNLVTKITVYITSLALTYVYTKELWKIYKNKLSTAKLIQEVDINISGKKYKYNGFIDTGNTVKSYELGVPVVFAEYLDEEQKKLVKKLPKYNVSVSTISKQSEEKVILIKKAKINGNVVDIGVVFVERKLNRKNDYNMILNYELYEESLGGVSI